MKRCHSIQLKCFSRFVNDRDVRVNYSMKLLNLRKVIETLHIPLDNFDFLSILTAQNLLLIFVSTRYFNIYRYISAVTLSA